MMEGRENRKDIENDTESHWQKHTGSDAVSQYHNDKEAPLRVLIVGSWFVSLVCANTWVGRYFLFPFLLGKLRNNKKVRKHRSGLSPGLPSSRYYKLKPSVGQ